MTNVKRALLFSESNTKLKKMSVGNEHIVGVTLREKLYCIQLIRCMMIVQIDQMKKLKKNQDFDK